MEKEIKKNTKKNISTTENKQIKKDAKKTITPKKTIAKKTIKPVENKKETIINEVVSNEMVSENKKNVYIPPIQKKGKKKGLIIILSIILALCFIGIILLIVLPFEKISQTHKVAQKLIDKYDFKVMGRDEIFIHDESKDMDYDYSYLEESIIYMAFVEKENSEIIDYDISISRYGSEIEAKAKINYYKDYYKALHDKIDNTFLEELYDYKNMFKNEKVYYFNIGNFLVGINNKYEPNYSKIEKILKEIIEVDKNNNVDETTVANYWKSEINKQISKIDRDKNIRIDKIKDSINDVISKLDSCSLENCISLFNEVVVYDKYEEVKEEINKLKEKYNQVIVTIGDFSGTSYNDGKAWCDENMKYCSVTQEYSDSVPNGGFISQSITANTAVKRSDSFKLVYSKGKEPSLEFKNALEEANSYLKAMPFSYSGLIKQIEFEGYSHDAAVYAADNCGADWNEQAAKDAEQYLKAMSFSRQGLIDQLLFEGYTYEQAVYGVTAVGY